MGPILNPYVLTKKWPNKIQMPITDRKEKEKRNEGTTFTEDYTLEIKIEDTRTCYKELKEITKYLASPKYNN